MSEVRFDVVFRGQVLPGRSAEAAAQSLAATFKLTPEKVAQYFTGQPYTVARGLDAEKAEKYRAAFEAAGAVCELVACGPVSPSGPEPPPAGPASGATCPQCGLLQAAATRCARCGAEISSTPLPHHLPVAAPVAPAPRPTSVAKSVFQDPKTFLWTGGVLAVLIVVLFVGLVVRMLPKDPPRADFLRIATDLMDDVEAIGEVVEKDARMSTLLYDKGEAVAGMSVDQMGVVVQEATKQYEGSETGAQELQRSIDRAGIAEDFRGRLTKRKDALAQLREKCGRASPEFQARFLELEELLKVSDQFAHIAVNPGRCSTLMEYSGKYKLGKILVAGLYAAEFEKLQAMGENEPLDERSAWVEEERAANEYVDYLTSAGYLKESARP
jgi:hypothetical protein